MPKKQGEKICRPQNNKTNHPPPKQIIIHKYTYNEMKENNNNTHSLSDLVKQLMFTL